MLFHLSMAGSIVAINYSGGVLNHFFFYCAGGLLFCHFFNAVGGLWVSFSPFDVLVAGGVFSFHCCSGLGTWSLFAALVVLEPGHFSLLL